jgi:hypothetical protein
LENDLLTAPFTLEETHTAIFQMDPNKAPDLDSFFILSTFLGSNNRGHLFYVSGLP